MASETASDRAANPRRVLHIGSGHQRPAALHEAFRGEGWQEIRVHHDAAARPDIVAPIVAMPEVADGSVHAVWSSHNLEPLAAHEVPLALGEFRRVLAPGGFVLLTVLDLQAVAEHIAAGRLEEPLVESPIGPMAAIDLFYGPRDAVAGGSASMARHTGFTAATLAAKLADAGFERVRVERQGLSLRARAHRPGTMASENPVECAPAVDHAPDATLALETGHATDGQRAPEVGADSDAAATWHRQGLIQIRQRRYPAAIDAFEQVLAVAPDDSRAHNNLGVCYEALGEMGKALAHYRRAAALDPANHKAHRNAGKLLAEDGDIAGGIAAQQRALALRPDYALAHNDLGICYERLGDEAEALAAYRRAIALDPRSAVAHNNLGNLYFHQGQAQPALDNLKRAIELDPGLSEAYGNLAAALAKMGELEAAHASYARALDIAPDSPAALAAYALSCQKLCEWDRFGGLLPGLEAITRAELAAGKRTSVAPFAALSLPWPTELQAAISRAAARRIELTMRGRRDALAFGFDRAARMDDPRRPLRIGYLSANFRNHALSHLFTPVFGLHDRDRVRVYTYSQGEDDGSEYRRRIVADSDVFRDQRGWSHAEIARQIHADGVDILVELHGHTDQHRLQVCALRPAPIVVTYIGFPGCLGAGFVDYAVTDAIVTPPGEADLYTESLALMPDSYYVTDDTQAIDPAPITRADFGLPDDGVVYCCFNGSYKIDPLIFERWMAILRAVPGSVLWLWIDAPVVRRNLQAAAEAAGVAGTRLVFAEQIGKARHLARLSLADLFLDTRLYNAHTTACDALWAGVPVLTCPAATFAGRVGASLLTAIGLPELIAPDLDAYVELAVRLGRDAERLAALKHRLAEQRAVQPLFDTARWVRNLEAVYGWMWEGVCGGIEQSSVTEHDR